MFKEGEPQRVHMVTEAWMVSEVLQIVPDATIEATDLHGSGDHFHVRVISKSYEGVRPLQRQIPILHHFKPYIAQNIVHASSINCWSKCVRNGLATS